MGLCFNEWVSVGSIGLYVLGGALLCLRLLSPCGLCARGCGLCGWAKRTRGCMSGAFVLCSGRFHAIASICSLARLLNNVSRDFCCGCPSLVPVLPTHLVACYRYFVPPLSLRWPRSVVGGAERYPCVPPGLLSRGSVVARKVQLCSRLQFSFVVPGALSLGAHRMTLLTNK